MRLFLYILIYGHKLHVYITTFEGINKVLKHIQKLYKDNEGVVKSLEDIEVYKNKLEGIGLLKTYLNEELRVYKYELYAPLTPKDFFTHELLGTLYKQIMPKRSYEKIKSSFEVETSDYDNYTDITHKFNDVYNIDFNDVSSLQEVIRGGANLANKSSSEIESNFSLSLFLVALNEKKIKKSLII